MKVIEMNTTVPEPNPEGLPMPLRMEKTRQCDVLLGTWTDFNLDDGKKPDVGPIRECLLEEFSQGAPRHWALFVSRHPPFLNIEDACDWTEFLERALWPPEAEIAYSTDGVCCYMPTEPICVDGKDNHLVVFLVHHRDNRRASAASGCLPQLLTV